MHGSEHSKSGASRKQSRGGLQEDSSSSGTSSSRSSSGTSSSSACRGYGESSNSGKKHKPGCDCEYCWDCCNSYKVQIIRSLDDEIRRGISVLIFDVSTPKCKTFKLGRGYKDGHQLTIIVQSIYHSVVQNKRKYEQFFELHIRKKGQTALLEWNECKGWSILSTMDNPKVKALAVNKPHYLYVPCTRRRTPSRSLPDYVAIVDVSPKSMTKDQIVSRTDTVVGDELHHAHLYTRPDGKSFLIAPGLYSGAINIMDVSNPRHVISNKRIESEKIQALGLSTLHTTHNYHNGDLLISALSDENGQEGAGFVYLPSNFDENAMKPLMKYDGLGYDFNMKECIKTMISSEWSYRNVFDPGFDPLQVAEGKYGHKVRIWDFWTNTLKQVVDLRDNPNVPNGGEIPLEVRFFHSDTDTRAYVGCTLSGTIIALILGEDGTWSAKEVIHVPPVNDVIAAITDITISEDDRYLYFSDWLHGDLRQYDIKDWLNPVLMSRVWMGGLIGEPIPTIKGKFLNGGPQMLRLTSDGSQLYVTNSLYSSWDDQFYNTPENSIAENGSWLCRVDTGIINGRRLSKMSIDEDFLIDFGKEPGGPSRCHEVHIPGVDH